MGDAPRMGGMLGDNGGRAGSGLDMRRPDNGMRSTGDAGGSMRAGMGGAPILGRGPGSGMLGSQPAMGSSFMKSDSNSPVMGGGFLGRTPISPNMGAMGSMGGGRSAEPNSGLRSDTILVRNLPLDTAWHTLRDRFGHAGEVKYAEMKERGVGVVRFSSEREAERAKMMMDGQVVEGRSITVTFH